MGLMLSALPNFNEQLTSLQRAIQEKNQRIAELEIELREERTQNAASRASVEGLRITLAPLYQGLQLVFGHIEAIGDADSPRSPRGSADSSTREVWKSWKQKLGGKTAEAIDVLLMHGPVTHTQLRIQLHCATRTVTNIVGALNKAGLINKANGKISLKEL